VLEQFAAAPISDKAGCDGLRNPRKQLDGLGKALVGRLSAEVQNTLADVRADLTRSRHGLNIMLPRLDQKDRVSALRLVEILSWMIEALHAADLAQSDAEALTFAGKASIVAKYDAQIATLELRPVAGRA